MNPVRVSTSKSCTEKMVVLTTLAGEGEEIVRGGVRITGDGEAHASCVRVGATGTGVGSGFSFIVG
jgi:hypothetical protein